jgi:RHS repeat-associated protein
LNDGSTTVTSETLAANSGWTRLEVSYTNTSSAAKSVTARLMTAAAGTTYMDCVQVEKAPTASRYNLIENGDFTYSGYAWSSNTGRTTVTAANKTPAPQLDTYVYKMTGNPSGTNRISQTVNVSGAKGDTLVLAGWAKADSVPIKDTREFALIATFKNGSTTVNTSTVRFNYCADSSIQWQYAASPIVAKGAFTSVTIELAYDYNANTAYFDGIQLYKEEFGNSYTYDEKGNIISVKDVQSQTTSYEYTNNDLTKQILPSGAALTYTYDSYHNVKTATSDTGVVYNFAYDTYGNNTSVSIVSGSVKLTSSATYTSDGNRLSKTTDAAGKVTTYSYNENTNVLEWVQYPEDTTATRTEYTYDNMYRLAKAETDVSTGTTLTASYGYTNDLLTSIATGSTTYSFTYGAFALRSNIKIGSRTLASYTYTSRNNFLDTLAYGNGDSVKYTYDKQGRVTKQTYEDGDTVTYKYDNSGALASVTDSATGITTTYYYDYSDRLLRYAEKGSSYSHIVGYEYDEINNLTALVETINGTEHKTTYDYDDDNRVRSVANGSASEAYTYDAYSRVNKKVTKNGSTTVLTDTFTYRAPNSTTTSGQVATLKSAASGYNVTYTYTYDDNGNILSVSDGSKTTSYVYDSANQLTRENNQAAGKTWVWAYDDAGNITSRKEYAYTTGTLGTVVDTITYTYGDSAWGDLLTAYDGNTVTSDAIGNMLSDGTWTYTWEHGRELATMSNGSTTWTYTYNADGLRTSRTNGSTTYSYVYNGSSLSQMTVGSNTLYFAYDASGTPMSVTYNGTNYYYATNLQGDVTAILNTSGTAVVQYTYDAWGKLLTTTGSMASTLGAHNPLTYRGYVYDNESGLYYLQSRYYNPALGRFLNADAFIATGQGILGNNMFTYCSNNPANRIDTSGMASKPIPVCFDSGYDEEEYEPSTKQANVELQVLETEGVSFYNGVPVIRMPFGGNSGFSAGIIFLGDGVKANESGIATLKHEY